MRPASMFRQPIEKRKKADTRVKSSTWWERTAALIKHWMIPKAPKPRSSPRTGKKRLKNTDGQPN
ncbi:hypothetical protein EV421DRAFT_1858508, partial [Armillaria borealis]